MYKYTRCLRDMAQIAINVQNLPQITETPPKKLLNSEYRNIARPHPVFTKNKSIN